MIKITNPYSRRRFTIKEKFYKKFTDIIVPYLKKMNIQKDCRIKQKYIPKVIQKARQQVDVWESFKWEINKPVDIQVDFLSIYVSEYIPIENVDNLNRGLKKLYKKYHTGLKFGHAEHINEFCNEAKQSIHVRSWSNFGYLDLSKDKKLSNLISQVHIRGMHIYSSSIILQFTIIPSDIFIKEYKKIMNEDIKASNVFIPSFKSFFKYWGSHGKPGSSVKEQILEDLRLELKWKTMKEINRYFDMYFTKKKLIPPSIEIYKINHHHCIITKKEDEERNNFWDSIGMNTFIHNISKDGYWQLFYEKRDYLLDSSVKITCNTEIKREPLYHSLDFQIVYSVEEFAGNLLPIFVMREYAVDLSKSIAFQQKDTFSSIKKEKPKYRRIINIRYELEKSLYILKLFKNEIDENYFDRIKKKITELSDFEPSRPKFNNIVWTEFIVDDTNFLIDKTYNYSYNFAKMIDDTVRLLDVRTNNSLRKITFLLTIVTVVLSTIATTIAGISLYFQFHEKTKQSLYELFNQIKNIFF